ncbi:hypothetical protein [Arachnia propionica]|uniref:Uncharacterized protein n=1 Tax=Arachnia propionica TaxID=1750 RepID=A0A3P1WW19_9ACTN|nr:hypothetical protein [Arachnia propionica]RRD50792.1 hypothetical protein EII35_03430 [Arachnia propionica]
MKSRRFVLAGAVGLAMAPVLPASLAEATRRSPRPTATPSPAPYRLEPELGVHFVPAADAAAHYRELNIWLRVFNLRERHYQAQVMGLKYRQRYEFDSVTPILDALDRHHVVRNIALLRFLLAVLKAEGNAEARSLDLEQVGVDAAVTEQARPLIRAEQARAKERVGRYADEREQSARQARLTLFTDANAYIGEWVRASRAGLQFTDYAPYVPFFLGGHYQAAVYIWYGLDPEDKPLKTYWRGSGTDPVDVVEAMELSKVNKAYFDGLASLDDNPLFRTTYAA